MRISSKIPRNKMKFDIIILFGALSFVVFTEAIVTYPNFVESLHLNPIKFPQDGPKPTTTTTTTAKPVIGGLAPIVIPIDPNTGISPRIGILYGLPVYVYV